jgi:hypothetical protein
MLRDVAFSLVVANSVTSASQAQVPVVSYVDDIRVGDVSNLQRYRHRRH